eukprot:m.138770 g.138770  ORF g.138770 m.138770 type:complete len:329 (-) comp30013_c0_seq1:98-1084(-)
MMRSSQFLSTGDPLQDTTIKISDQAKPEPGCDDVVIRAVALSLNPVDYKILKGQFPDKTKPRGGWGSDISGVVDSVGSAVTRFKVGDEVYADGIFAAPMAEFCCIPATVVSSKPTNMSHTEAASVPLAGLTALQAIRDHGKMKAGARVCVFGGSGGVGTLAIQIAKALGASHIATTSSNVELCKSLGADEVVNYRETPDIVTELTKSGGDYDIVFDAVGGNAHWLAAQEITKSSGHFVTIAGDGGSMTSTIAKAMWRKFGSNFKGPSYQIFLTNNAHADLDVLTALIEEGKIKATIDGAPYKFGDEGIAEMLTKLMSGRTKGKLVMEM